MIGNCDREGDISIDIVNACKTIIKLLSDLEEGKDPKTLANALIAFNALLREDFTDIYHWSSVHASELSEHDKSEVILSLKKELS